jgi:hypothetical protein
VQVSTNILAVGIFIFVWACGPSNAPPIQVAETCTTGDLTIEVEAGGAGPSCADLTLISQQLRAAYEERFGHQNLDGIRVRFRGEVFIDRESHTGHTYADAIDLGSHQWDDLPHELNHVRTGAGHTGWCLDFEPWSEAVLGIEERAYLACH